MSFIHLVEPQRPGDPVAIDVGRAVDDHAAILRDPRRRGPGAEMTALPGAVEGDRDALPQAR